MRPPPAAQPRSAQPPPHPAFPARRRGHPGPLRARTAGWQIATAAAAAATGPWPLRAQPAWPRVPAASGRRFPGGTAYPLSPPREGLRCAWDFLDSPRSARAGGQPREPSTGGKRKLRAGRCRFVSGSAGRAGASENRRPCGGRTIRASRNKRPAHLLIHAHTRTHWCTCKSGRLRRVRSENSRSCVPSHSRTHLAQARAPQVMRSLTRTE